MASTAISGNAYLPQPPSAGNASPAYTFLTIDAASEKAAMIFEVPKSGTVSHIRWGSRTVTTGATVDVRLETVSTSTGNPTGTLYGTNTNGSQVVGNGDDNTWFRTALTASATVTKGDTIAVVIVNPGSPGNMQVACLDFPSRFPYIALDAGGYGRTSVLPMAALEYNDGSFAESPGVWPASAINSVTINSGTTPDEWGLLFQMPVPCSISGAWFVMTSSGGGTNTMRLYDASDNILEWKSIFMAQRASSNPGIVEYLFDTPVALTGTNANHRLTLRPDANDILVYDFDVPTAAMLGCFGGGTTHMKTTRVNDGSWTDLNTNRPMMGLLISSFDNGAGGGGGGILIHPGMTGGMGG